MKCFYYFKDKSRSKSTRRSAPELHNPISNSSSDGVCGDTAVDQRTIRSTESAAPRDQTAGGGVIQRSLSSGTNNNNNGGGGLLLDELYNEKGGKLKEFSLSELRLATKDFNRVNKIGEGGFGCVYKGTLKGCSGDEKLDCSGSSTVDVAIKKLNKDGFQGHKQWLAEVQFLGIVEHPNLVKLIGYCALDGERGIQRLLVYEYMSNRSLEDHLFTKLYPPLPWDKRLHIILGAAQGLAYLHEELPVQVIFRDFKTSNVLLDDDFQAKLSDFGLAREGPIPGRTHVSTAVVGTYGYAAPDYIETGHLTSKSDVWSFGVVLYEILTGRRSLERSRPRSEQRLLDWVKQYPIDGKKFHSIMDTKLEGQYSVTAARKIAKLADTCLIKASKDRPKMSQVVERLKQIINETKGDGCDGRVMKKSGGSECDGVEEERSSSGSDSERKKTEKRMGSSESARRRIAHLAKLGDHIDGFSKRKFMIMQRAKVT